jgi:hypothetical protein
MWASTTIIKHPAPISCSKTATVLILKNEITEPKSNMPAGTNPASAFANVAFIRSKPRSSAKRIRTKFSFGGGRPRTFYPQADSLTV